jgi:Ca2+/Na+ antiporter
MIGAVMVQITNGELDGVRPAALKRYISQEEWNSLAISVRQILFKGVHLNDIMTGFRRLLLFCLLTFVVFVVFLGQLGLTLSLYFALFILFFVLSLCCSCYRQCVLGNAVEDELRQFLAQYSRKNQAGVTLHLLQDGSGAVRALEERTKGANDMVPVDFVLQISVDQELGYRAMQDLTSPPSVHNSMVAGERDEIKIRLEKLERAKEYLSVEEYDEKRQAILNSI